MAPEIERRSHVKEAGFAGSKPERRVGAEIPVTAHQDHGLGSGGLPGGGSLETRSFETTAQARKPRERGDSFENHIHRVYGSLSGTVAQILQRREAPTTELR